MENVNELIKNFRERTASPFFFSFMLAWIFFNWKVSIALIWYDSELYPQQGDLIKYISKNTSTEISTVWPLFSVFFYTAVVKNAVSALVTWSTKWGSDLNLSISKESKVSMAKFLAYRSMYLQTYKSLEKVIEDESKTIEDLDQERQRASKLAIDNLALQGEVSQLNSTNTDLINKCDFLAEALKGTREVLIIRRSIFHRVRIL